MNLGANCLTCIVQTLFGKYNYNEIQLYSNITHFAHKITWLIFGFFYHKDDDGDGNEFDNDGDDYNEGGNNGNKHFWCGKVSSEAALPDTKYLVNDWIIVDMSSTSKDSLNIAR